MTGAAWGTGSDGENVRGMTPPTNNLFIEYATELRGKYYRRGTRQNLKGRVHTRIDKWTVILEGHSDCTMRAPYESLDGFAFKVAAKGPLHGLLGRVFGSRDIDIGDHVQQEHYSVGATNEAMIRQLLMNQQFGHLQEPWESHWLIERLQSRQRGDAHEIEVDIGDTVNRMNALERLLAIHALVAFTLRKLVDMGSASREHVEVAPPEGDWKVVD